MFLAARLTRYSLGLAATLSTLLLHRTLAHAINFFLSLARHSWFLHCCFLGGFGGGLLTFLAARLTRYSLGLAATLSTLLLHRTLAHAINFFLSLARHSWFLHCCFLGGLGGADNVLGCPPYKIFSWTCCYAIDSSLAPYPGTRYQLLLVTCKTLLIFALLFLGGGWGGLITFLAARLTRYSLGLAATLKREMAIIKWVKVCVQWSSNGSGVKQFCRALSICWRNIMTFNDGFIHWNK